MTTKRPESAFRGRVAIVTGGGTGIGRAIALRLAQYGASLVLAGRRQAPLEEAVALIEQHGGQAIGVPTDLASQSDIERLVEEATQTFGRIDHVINNAIMNYGGAFDTLTIEQVRHMIDVGFTAPLLLSRLVLPEMRARRFGSVVMIGSTAFVGWPEVVTYSAIKSGLEGFAQGLRREVAADGVHVAVVHPAGTDTPSMTAQARRAFTTLGFKIYPSDVVARAVVDAIVLRRPSVIIGGWEKRHVWASKLDPRLIDRKLGRMRKGFQEAMHEHRTPS